MNTIFPKQTKTTLLNHRLAGTAQEYWTLKLMLDGELVNVHTSKSRAYLRNIADRWTK